jgi:uncharacterized protein YjgD (DUF1641 family)
MAGNAEVPGVLAWVAARDYALLQEVLSESTRMKILVKRSSLPIQALLMLAAAGLSGCHRGDKAPECKVLVNSLSELGERLEEVRYVASGADVKPTDISDVLRPFSSTAKKVAASLKASSPTVSTVRNVSDSAAAAASALSVQAVQMAELVEQMTDVDVASKAVDDHKQAVDKLELQIKEICGAEPSKCTDLSVVLARFPAPTDQSDVTEDAQAWTQKLGIWTAELATVNIQNPVLKERVTDFGKNWQELGQAMSRMVSALELGKKYEALTKAFNEQIQRANQAIADANAQCARN